MLRSEYGGDMRTTQKKLLEFLKDCERNQRPFTVADAADASGHSETTIRTYLSKKLVGHWVEKARDGHYRAKELLVVTPLEFEAHMSQKAVDAFGTYVQWKRHLEHLVQLGRQQGYQVEPALEELLSRPREAAPARKL